MGINRERNIWQWWQLREHQKAVGLITKTTILHIHLAFLNISLPLLHDYDVKKPNFTFDRQSTQVMISELGCGSKEFIFRRVTWVIAMKIERCKFTFSATVFLPSLSSHRKVQNLSIDSGSFLLQDKITCRTVFQKKQ